MSSDKERFRKMLTEIENETLEKLPKINAISDREQRNKAMDDFMMWRVQKQTQLLSEFKKWVWSD